MLNVLCLFVFGSTLSERFHSSLGKLHHYGNDKGKPFYFPLGGREKTRTAPDFNLPFVCFAARFEHHSGVSEEVIAIRSPNRAVSSTWMKPFREQPRQLIRKPVAQKRWLCWSLSAIRTRGPTTAHSTVICSIERSLLRETVNSVMIVWLPVWPIAELAKNVIWIFLVAVFF